MKNHCGRYNFLAGRILVIYFASLIGSAICGISQNILVTGGAGYVGSHVLILLLERGYNVTIFDNLSHCVQVAPEKSKPESILRVELLTGKSCRFEKGDLRNIDELRNTFNNHGPFDAVLHFGGLKSVGESVRSPIKYYQNNVYGSLNLLQVMNEFGVKNIIFSSSSTVYGKPKYLPLDEKHPTGNCQSPYGRTKHIIEEMMLDLSNSDPSWKTIMLRYFNPIGSHPSGQIGEDPPEVPRNLVPYLSQIAVGRRKTLKIFGNDYDTPDGTGIRGYIHVMDLAAGHVKALEKLLEKKSSGWKVYNLGMGVGHSVLQVHAAFEKAASIKIPYKFVPRRPGDVPATYAICTLAEKELNWKPKHNLTTMCEDSWRWQKQNPNGYASSLDCSKENLSNAMSSNNDKTSCKSNSNF